MTGPRVSTLDGLAGLVQGIGAFHDPDKQKRDMLQKLILQDPTLVNKLQQNPQLLDQMVGKRPRGFGQDDYDNLINSIKNAPKSSDQLGEEFKQNELTRALALQKQSNANDALSGLDQVGQGQVPGGLGAGATQGTPDFASIPFAKLRQSLSPDQQQQLDEMRAKVTGSLTPVERKTEQLGLTSAQNTVNTQNDAATKNAYYKAQLKTVTDKFPNYSDVYQAIQSGKLSPDQVHAIEYFPESAKALDDARTEHHYRTMEGLQRSANEGRFDVNRYIQESTAQTAKYIVEKTGSSDPISVYTVMNTDGLKDKLLAGPKPTDPAQARLWEAAQAIKGYSDDLDSAQITKANTLFNKDAGPIINRIKGVSPKGIENDQSEAQMQADINLLNQKSAAYFRPLGLKPLKFNLKSIRSGILGDWSDMGEANKHDVELVDGDPKLIDGTSDLGIAKPTPQEAQTTKPNALGTANEDSVKADAFEKLKKKYPKETTQQIIDRVTKGER